MGALAAEVLAPLGTARQPINTEGPQLQRPCHRASLRCCGPLALSREHVSSQWRKMYGYDVPREILRHLSGIDSVVDPSKLSHLGHYLINKSGIGHCHGPQRRMTPAVYRHTQERSAAIGGRDATPALLSPGWLPELALQSATKEALFQHRLSYDHREKRRGQRLYEEDRMHRDAPS
jgi:hypothetical protein